MIHCLAGHGYMPEKGRFGRVELGVGHLAIGIDIGLLIDPAHAFHGAHIERVLRAQITGVRSVDLTPGLVVELLLLQRLNLGFGEDYAFFGDLGFERLQSRLEVGQPTCSSAALIASFSWPIE